MPPLRVIQLTPPGRGAIATLLVEGPAAAQAVEAIVRDRREQPLARRGADRLAVGYVGGPPGEEVVVRARSNESVEVHCHGGLVAAATIERQLIDHGCRPVAWQDWLISVSADPIAAAAHAALALARTERTAVILLDQYHGALRDAFNEIEAAITRQDAALATQRIDVLLRRAALGQHLVAPWRVVLAGHPNVGKSSLINALAGYSRAIVHATPGTTRDVVSVQTAIGGWPVELSDTAGLRVEAASDDPIERAGIALARQKLASADLAILVFDCGVPWSDGDQTLVDSWPNVLVVHNKSDLLPRPEPRGLSQFLWHEATKMGLSPSSPQPRPMGLYTSAISGDGVTALVAAIADRLVPEPLPPGAAVPFTADQIAHLTHLTEIALKMQDSI